MSTPFLDELNSIFGSNLKRNWKLHETAGTTAADATSNQDGEHVGGPTVGQDPLSLDAGAKSVSYDGVDDLTTQASDGQFEANRDPPFTFGVVFRTTASGIVAPMVGWWRNGNTHNDQQALGLASDGKLRMAAPTSSGGIIHVFGDPVNDGEVHLAVAVYESATVRRGYRDGVKHDDPSSDSADHSTFGATARRFRLAQRGEDGSSRLGFDDLFDGRLEYAFFANQVPTDVEMADLWAALTAAPPTGAEGSGEISAESSLEGTGLSIFVGSGEIISLGNIEGTGLSISVGSAAIEAIAILEGTGQAIDIPIATGFGEIESIALIEGTGKLEPKSSGIIESIALLEGTGVVLALGSGKIAAVSEIIGIGRSDPIEFLTVNTTWVFSSAIPRVSKFTATQKREIKF